MKDVNLPSLVPSILCFNIQLIFQLKFIFRLCESSSTLSVCHAMLKIATNTKAIIMQ